MGNSAGKSSDENLREAVQMLLEVPMAGAAAAAANAAAAAAAAAAAVDADDDGSLELDRAVAEAQEEAVAVVEAEEEEVWMGFFGSDMEAEEFYGVSKGVEEAPKSCAEYPPSSRRCPDRRRLLAPINRPIRGMRACARVYACVFACIVSIDRLRFQNAFQQQCCSGGRLVLSRSRRVDFGVSVQAFANFRRTRYPLAAGRRSPRRTRRR